MKLEAVARDGARLVEAIDVAPETPVQEVKRLLHSAGLGRVPHPDRQRLTLPSDGGDKAGPPVQDDATVSTSGLHSAGKVVVKDLGPQIGYKAVFVWEYLGPLVIYPLFYAFQRSVYGEHFRHDRVQAAALAYWSLHYTKRLLETLVVHKFSRRTMPLKNLFRNCGYYWIFAALVSYYINHPHYWSPPWPVSVAAFSLGLACQVCNLRCHLILASLRGGKSSALTIPRGFAFESITCANYTFEILAWLCFNVATQTLMGVVFMLCGGYQMVLWGVQKHKKLKRTFDGKEGRPSYPSSRWIVLPPFL